MGLFQNHMMAAAVAATADTAYSVDNSLRLNSPDDPYMTKTFGSAGNRKTWTMSCWVKLGRMRTGDGNYAGLFRQALHYVGFRKTAALGRVHFNISGVFSAFGGATNTHLHRDPAAWYHFVFIFDTTESTAANRIKMYVNNTLLATTTEGGSIPAEDYDGPWLNNAAHELFRASSSNDYILDGYVSEFIVCDGTAYPPSNFAETNSQGVWVPKKISGLTFGTNGFYLDFASSGDLGNDVSGNNNDWSLTNIDSANQSTDTPTNNKVTFNPLNNQQSGGDAITEGNTIYNGPGTRTMISLTANIPSTGKWAVAFSSSGVSTNAGWNFGITKSNNSNFNDAAGSNEDVGASDGVNMSPSSSDLQLYGYVSSTSIDPTLPITTSDEFWMAVDMATGKCFLGIYDASATSMIWVANDAGLDGNPADGSNPTETITAMIGSTEYTFAAAGSKGNENLTLKRAADISGTIPSGYTYFENVSDFPAPDVLDPSTNFQTQLYAGNGGTQSITFGGNSDMQPDIVLLKDRESTYVPNIYDAARGVQKYLQLDNTGAEATDSSTLTAFNSDGFSLGSAAWVNGSNDFVSWNWSAGNSGSSNTAGTINTTTTYVDTTAGISVSTYTGTGSNATVGHGLGVTPQFVFIKARDQSGQNWVVLHPSIANTQYLKWDSDSAAVTSSLVWNDTSPTSTVVSIGTGGWVNDNTKTYVMYAFAEVPGFSSFGSYIGNGNADAPFSNMSFRPAMVIVKPTTRTDGWIIWDTKRNTSNLTAQYLTLDTTNIEYTGTVRILDIVSNGFKIKSSHNSVNNSGDTYAYIAFAESPFGGDGAAPATAR